jgi:hypothetical protein
MRISFDDVKAMALGLELCREIGPVRHPQRWPDDFAAVTHVKD